MRIPVISSRRGVLPELVRDGQTGRVVDEDPEQLAAAMREVARDPVCWSAWGQAARSAVLESYTIERGAERLEKLYSSLGSSRSAAA